LSRYRIFETEEFIKDSEKLSKNIRNKLTNKLINYVYPQLSERPHFGLNIKKLRNYNPDTWRYRVGDYRIFYEIDENELIIYITAIDQRKDAY